jgi:hypothetical protein
VRVYATRSGRSAHDLPARAGQASPNFSRDGSALAVNDSFDGRVQVFDWPSRRLIIELSRRVRTAALDDRGAYLATSAGPTTWVWEARTGERVGTFTGLGDATLLTRRGEGAPLVVSSGKGAVQLTACEVCRSRAALLALARARGARTLSAAERRRYLHE